MDKLLNAVKDFATIQRYLEAINQTTDDYLFLFDIPNNQLQFFGTIGDMFDLKIPDGKAGEFEEILPIVHPADVDMLCAGVKKIRTGEMDALDHDFRLHNRRGETIWVNARGKVLHDEQGAPYAMLGRVSEEALRHLYNPLTGLRNIAGLRADLKTRLNAGGGWLMFLSIPSLADIRLSHGKTFGNQVLCGMADELARLDGAERTYHIDYNNFAVILRACSEEQAEAFYRQICRSMLGICAVYAGAVPMDAGSFTDAAQLIDAANMTLHEAMQSPTAHAEFFLAGDISRRISEFTLLEELKESVRNHFEGFEVYYQPQIRSTVYELYGVEALLRYQSKKRGRVFPDVFIPLLEQAGLMQDVGMWVLETALAQCRTWREHIPGLRVAVNFSSVQFEDERLGERIVDALKTAGLPGNALTVELTESVRLGENEHDLAQIRYIKSYGVRFSIDDFGTGYSNLKYLKYLDVNEIKIDRSFVSGIEPDTYNYRLIGNVMELAKTNSIGICCEGVETAQELSVLEPLHADVFQGYLFDKPCPAGEIEDKYMNPAADAYQARIRALYDICRYQEQYGGIHFDPKTILHENNIGLWILRIDARTNRYELHADEVMLRVLGLCEKLPPEECYEHWHSRICPENVEAVDRSLAGMIAGGKAVQLEYRWKHPTEGIVSVRSSGIRVQDDNGRMVLEGYHRNLTEVVSC